MTFNSLAFVVFFAVVYGLYLGLQHKAQNRLLLVASVWFYGWWDWRFLGLLLASILIDYTCARWMARPRSTEPTRRLALILALTGDLGILFVFKYYNFFCDSGAWLLSELGFNVHHETLQIILPLGISFYTFQAMSYTVDVFRGHTQPIRNFMDFSLYVMFFPQLVAGPIERSTHLIPMITHPRAITREKVMSGLGLVITGYFKKIVIADNLAPVVESVFDSPCPGVLSGPDVLVGVYCFALQIYGDFAGYSDIARGLARLMGFELMLNFRRPYFASNPSDFWQRWHISLSTWLRDYLYVPLGGNRKGSYQTYRNLMVTMLLGGLWHGAAANFVLWGGYHGLLLVFFRPFRHWSKRIQERVPKAFRAALSIVGIGVMFHLTCYSWLLFRATSWERIQILTSRLLLGFPAAGFRPELWASLVYFGGVYMVYEVVQEIASRRNPDVPEGPAGLRPVLMAYMLAMILFHGSIDGAQFIYFQF